MNVWFLGAIVIAIVVMVVLIGNKKKKWCKIYGAKGEVLLVYRTQKDYWFGESVKDMITVHYETGDVAFVPRHWIMRIDRVKEENLQQVKEELKKLQDDLKNG